jgi:solute carrier family 25 protein 39/40
MIKISGKEGYQSLWRGLTPTLALTLPQTAVYFVVYEKLKDGIITELYTDSYAPAISGILARSMIIFAYTYLCLHSLLP